MLIEARFPACQMQIHQFLAGNRMIPISFAGDCHLIGIRIGKFILRFDYEVSMLIYKSKGEADANSSSPIAEAIAVIETRCYFEFAGIIDEAPSAAQCCRAETVAEPTDFDEVWRNNDIAFLVDETELATGFDGG